MLLLAILAGGCAKYHYARLFKANPSEESRTLAVASATLVADGFTLQEQSSEISDKVQAENTGGMVVSVSLFGEGTVEVAVSGEGKADREAVNRITEKIVLAIKTSD